MIRSALGSGTFKSYGYLPFHSDMSDRQTPSVTLKPGQASHSYSSRAYYADSTRNVPDGHGYTENYKRFDSTYARGATAAPRDYLGKTIATNNYCTRNSESQTV